jgi:hypothetical protein
MVRVYHAKVWDGAQDVVTPHKGTANWIAMINGAIIPETSEEVDPSSLDGQGRYVPRQESGKSISA